MKTVILSLLAFSLLTGPASAMLTLELEGVLKSYNSETALLQTKRGQMRVPRSFLNYHQATHIDRYLNKKLTLKLPVDRMDQLSFAKDFKKGPFGFKN